jgi:hypothetical protein
MTRSAAVLLGSVIATALSSAPVMAADFSSWWRIEAHYQNGSGATPVCFFQQAGSLLAGTCKGPNAIGAVEGQANGDQVMFTIHYRAYTPSGISGNGQFTVQRGPDGNMSVTSMNAAGVPGQFVGMRH